MLQPTMGELVSKGSTNTRQVPCKGYSENIGATLTFRGIRGCVKMQGNRNIFRIRVGYRVETDLFRRESASTV